MLDGGGVERFVGARDFLALLFDRMRTAAETNVSIAPETSTNAVIPADSANAITMYKTSSTISPVKTRARLVPLPMR